MSNMQILLVDGVVEYQFTPEYYRCDPTMYLDTIKEGRQLLMGSSFQVLIQLSPGEHKGAEFLEECQESEAKYGNVGNIWEKYYKPFERRSFSYEWAPPYLEIFKDEARLVFPQDEGTDKIWVILPEDM